MLAAPMTSTARQFRFLHTADLHLDSPLQSLAARDPELRALIEGATRQVLSAIVDLCLDESVDALLIAGDLYDGQQRNPRTVAVLASEMRRLQAAGIPVFIIKGNHDAESPLTASLDLPDNVHVFSGRGGSVALDDRAEIHGVSFAKRHSPESLLPKYRPPVAGRFNIGMLHTSLSGSPRHDVYAPCSIDELKAFGYDYWALGHIHAREVHASEPAIVMPGIPQGRHINESGARSVTLVTLEHGRPPVLDTRDVSIARFERLHHTLTEDADWQSLIRELTERLQALGRECPHGQLIVRVCLDGSSSLAFELYDRQAQLLEELALAIEQDGRIWIEKVELAVSAQAASTAAGDTAASPMTALLDAAAIEDAVLASPVLAEVVEAEWNAICKRIPASLREHLGTSEEAQRAKREMLLREGALEVLLRLQAGGRDAY